MTTPPDETGVTEAELIKTRRAKLDALRQTGRDPFVLTKFDRSHDIVAAREAFENLKVAEHGTASRVPCRPPAALAPHE